MKLTDREIATILHALRWLQDEGELTGADFTCEHFADCKPLSHDEIDELCEKLNFEEGS